MKLARLAVQVARPLLVKNFRATPRASAAIRASVSSGHFEAVDATAAAIIAPDVQTVVVDAPTVVGVARNAAAVDAQASASNAVPADLALPVTIAGIKVEAIAPAPRAARNSFPRCSKPVRR